jgi:hypothetical protein
MIDWLLRLYRPRSVIEWIALVIFLLLFGSIIIFGRVN